LIALDPTFDAFPDACTWPDHPRKRAEEHFLNVARTVQTITTATCQTAPKCLFSGIAADLEVLRTSTDDQAKLASLKFLGHWVGDIHCGIGLLGRSASEYGTYVTGWAPWTERPLPEVVRVAYPPCSFSGPRAFFAEVRW
jgi:hypothetical protein